MARRGNGQCLGWAPGLGAMGEVRGERERTRVRRQVKRTSLEGPCKQRQGIRISPTCNERDIESFFSIVIKAHVTQN